VYYSSYFVPYITLCCKPTPKIMGAFVNEPTNDASEGPTAKPRILVPEKVSSDGLALLSADFDVDFRPGGLSPQDLIDLIPGYDALIVRSETKVTAAVLSAGTRLRVVARAGVGVDNIDVNAATTQGIIVVNSPSGNIVAAAEHTVTLLLATARNVGRADRGVKAGRWDRGQLVGVEVGRKTLGIIGLGKVGMKVARIATAGLGMRVLAYDPYASADVARQAGVERLVADLRADLLPAVDFLTIHTPLLASTLDLLGEAEFRSMKPTARVLNVARGGVYNEEALLRALDEGWIAGAGIDVYTTEPPFPKGGAEEDAAKNKSAAARLARHDKVVATPHLGASTVEAQENVSLDVCAQVRTILRGGLPTAAVNAPLILPDEYRALQPFVVLVERMGALHTQHFMHHLHVNNSNSSGPDAVVGVPHRQHRFELVYQGDLAGVANTRPLFAALIKGLVASVSDAGGRDVNMVNAALIARDKGIVVDEVHARGKVDTYASLVTLRSYAYDEDAAEDGGGEAGEAGIGGAAYLSSASTSSARRAKRRGKEGSTSGATGTGKPAGEEHVIEGYVGGQTGYISKLGRFTASFEPEGTMLVLHNYDEPGKIGGVGMVLGRRGVNITWMRVASLEKGRDKRDRGEPLSKVDSAVAGIGGTAPSQEVAGGQVENKGDEALMILGVDGVVSKDVLEDLKREEGILDVSLIRL
jgi:D-3-phosphoglycerate dehydrogenase / 2-oxoglutarate reductase